MSGLPCLGISLRLLLFFCFMSLGYETLVDMSPKLTSVRPSPLGVGEIIAVAQV